VLRVMTAAAAGSLAAALALSLVGVNGQAADSFAAIRIWALAAIAALLIWRSRGSRQGPHSSSGTEPL
jgi:cyanate permease